jgi:hypothetical protein
MIRSDILNSKQMTLVYYQVLYVLNYRGRKLLYFQLEQARMNNEEFGILCLYEYTNDHIYIKLESAIYRVITIKQTRMLEGFIFLVLDSFSTKV